MNHTQLITIKIEYEYNEQDLEVLQVLDPAYIEEIEGRLVSSFELAFQTKTAYCR